MTGDDDPGARNAPLPMAPFESAGGVPSDGRQVGRPLGDWERAQLDALALGPLAATTLDRLAEFEQLFEQLVAPLQIPPPQSPGDPDDFNAWSLLDERFRELQLLLFAPLQEAGRAAREESKRAAVVALGLDGKQKADDEELLQLFREELSAGKTEEAAAAAVAVRVGYTCSTTIEKIKRAIRARGWTDLGMAPSNWPRPAVVDKPKAR